MSVNLGFTALKNFSKGRDVGKNENHAKILLRCLFIQHTKHATGSGFTELRLSCNHIIEL